MAEKLEVEYYPSEDNTKDFSIKQNPESNTVEISVNKDGIEICIVTDFCHPSRVRSDNSSEYKLISDTELNKANLKGMLRLLKFTIQKSGQSIDLYNTKDGHDSAVYFYNRGMQDQDNSYTFVCQNDKKNISLLLFPQDFQTIIDLVDQLLSFYDDTDQYSRDIGEIESDEYNKIWSIVSKIVAH